MKPQEANNNDIAIFWDYENCSVPSNLSGYDIVKQIRSLAHEFGSIKLLKAYTQLSEQAIHSSRSAVLRSELQSSGVSITDCPHNNYKNVADQMIIVDMLAFAMDNLPGPSSTTIMLISGDRDFAYALSILRLRRYNVVVVAPSNIHPSLRAQASSFFEWNMKFLAGTGKKESFHRSNNPRNQFRSINDDDSITMTPLGPILRRSTPPAAPASGGPSFLTNLRASQPLKEDSRLMQSPTTVYHAPDLLPTSMGLAEPFSDAPSFPARSYSNPRLHASPPGYYTPENSTHVMALKEINGIGRTPNTTTAACSNDVLPRELLSTPPSIHCDPGAASTSSNASLPVPDATKDKPQKEDLSALAPESLSSTKFIPRPPLPLSPRPSSAGPTLSGAVNTHRQSAIDIARRSDDDFGQPNLGTQAKPSPMFDHRMDRSGTSIVVAGKRVVDGVNLTSQEVSSMGRSSSHMLMQVAAATPHDQISLSPSKQDLIATIPQAESAVISELHSSLSASVVSAPPNVIPQYFLSLVQHLEKLRRQGYSNPLRSRVSIDLVRRDPQIYQRAGFTRFKEFAIMAEDMGWIQLGGKDGLAWIRLHPNFHGRIELNDPRQFSSDHP